MTAAPDIAAADYRRGGSQHGGDDGFDRGGAQSVLGAGKMSAGDVARLVSDHAHDLERVPAAHEKAGIDENVHSARHEGVQTVVVDQIDGDRRWIEARGVKQRRSINADNMFNLRVAQQADPALLRGGGNEPDRQEQDDRGERNDSAAQASDHG